MGPPLNLSAVLSASRLCSLARSSLTVKPALEISAQLTQWRKRRAVPCAENDADVFPVSLLSSRCCTDVHNNRSETPFLPQVVHTQIYQPRDSTKSLPALSPLSQAALIVTRIVA